MLAVKMPIPNLASYSLGALSGLLIFVLMFFPSAHDAKQKQADSYGNALAKTAARRGVDAAFGSDLVGLRVILQDSVENPDVRVATVHDVENNLLVQAGEVPYYAQKSDMMFTSPIILHDSIAGYVTVILSTTPSLSPFNSMLIGFCLLLFLAIAAWSLWQHESLGFYIPTWWKTLKNIDLKEQTHAAQDRNTANLNSNDVSKAPLNELEHGSSETAMIHMGYAAVGIKNIASLKQQLNGEVFRATFTAIESKVADVMNLYGGVDYQWLGDRYLLSFSSNESESEAIFHAACSAYLILELSSLIQNIPLDMSASVSNTPKLANDGSLPLTGLCTDQDGARSASLSARVELIEYEEDHSRMLIIGFNQPYKALLENQRRQLEGSQSEQEFE